MKESKHTTAENHKSLKKRERGRKQERYYKVVGK